MDRGTATAEADAPLGRAATASTLWLAAQKWVVRITGLVTIAVLTRNVSPEEFGVVAAASAVTPFILLLSDLGLSTYLVQANDPSRRTVNTAFWLTAATGAAFSVALALGAPFIAQALRVPAATSPVRALAVSAMLAILASIPSALLRRRMAFRRIALQGAAAAAVGQVVAIAVALNGGGAWALVWQLIASQAVITVLAWISAQWWPSPTFDRHQVRPMLRFGASVVSVEFVASARAAGETAIVAAALGAEALGFLNVAQRLVQVVQDLGATALVPVSTVVFAKVRESAERLRSAYLRALRLSYIAVAPMLVFVALGAPLLLPLLFGPQWAPSVPVARGLAVAGVLTLGAMVDHGLFYGVGAPGTWFWYAVVVDAVTLGTTAVLAPHGLVAVAWGFACVALLATIARWFLVARLIGIEPLRVARPFGSASVLVVVGGLAGLAALYLTTGLPALVSLVVVGLAVAVAHVLATRVVCPAVLRDALVLAPIPGRVARLLARFAGVMPAER